jgi:hypothetical protein
MWFSSDDMCHRREPLGTLATSHKINPNYSYGAVVGSQHTGSYLPVSKLFISSSSNSKSKTEAFSIIRLGVTLFGKGTNPFCRLQRRRICAGDLLCFFTKGWSRGSFGRRLENYWWRIWGSRKRQLDGATVAHMFAYISDGISFVPLRGPANRDEGSPPLV